MGRYLMVFLGILLDGRHLQLSIPLEKQEKALKLLDEFTGKRKATIKQLQVLTGYLNFLCKAISAGRIFTWRMYSKCSQYQTRKNGSVKWLKQYHHVTLDSEFKLDCEIWRTFLT